MLVIGIVRTSLVALLTLTLGAAGASIAAPTAEEIARVGTESHKRLQAGDAARWTSLHDTGKGVAFEFEILATFDKRRIDITAIVGDDRERAVQIIQRDGFWYVTEVGVRSKFFPYEAPLQVPALYLLLARSEPSFMTDSNLGELVDVDGSVVTFRVPMAPEQAEVIKRALETMTKALGELNALERQAIEAKMAQVQRRLEGIPIKVDARTGLLLESDTPEKRVRITSLEWVDDVEESAFAIDQNRWNDETEPLAARGSKDLAMISHAPLWRPGGREQAMDAMLVNVSTGKFRRIGTPYATPQGGCFSLDRTKVFITAYDSSTNAAPLFEVDLSKHTCRQLGGDQGAVGLNAFPCLSPRGESLLFLHKSADEPGIFDFRIRLLDLKSDEIKNVGQPMDAAFLSWLPDESAIILVSRESVGRDEPPRGSIARMTLDGTVSVLRAGERPTVIPERKRIFFEDQDDRWKTCNFDGTDEKLVGDGLQDFAFPSLSPDGTRLLMMKFDKTAGPRPHIVDLETGRTRELQLPEGLWAMPAWR